jgi:fructose-specific phosphotransferase system IIC component
MYFPLVVVITTAVHNFVDRTAMMFAPSGVGVDTVIARKRTSPNTFGARQSALIDKISFATEMFSCDERR